MYEGDFSISAKNFGNRVLERVGVKDRSVSEMLGRQTEFRWQSSPTNEWVGLSLDELKELVGEIGELLKITPNQAEKIRVYFGDHIEFNLPDGGKFTGVSYCMHDERRAFVVLNRSLEFVESDVSDLRETEPETLDEDLGNEGLDEVSKVKFYVKDKFEWLVWNIAEELMHAKIFLIAGTHEVEERWQENYQNIMRNKWKVWSSEEYSNDLQEVTVARKVMKILMKLNPDRIHYYRHKYSESIESKSRIHACTTSEFRKSFYIETGYDKDK